MALAGWTRIRDNGHVIPAYDDASPAARSAIDWVVFDLGRVVLGETTAVPELAALDRSRSP